MDKSTLRKEYLDKRKSLTRGQYWRLNESLMEQFEKYDWTRFNVVHVYLPIAEHKEVDTFSILQYFKEQHGKLKVVIPRTNFESLTIENVLYDPLYTILGKNKYGIPEPIHGKIIPSTNIDVVLMPLLAFDKKGNRVGYGKGFYDRFLSSCRPGVIKMGLSLFDPVDEIIEVNDFDQPMTSCITPKQFWSF